MKRALLLFLLAPTMASAQANINAWIMNLNGKLGSYWAQTGTPPAAPTYVFTNSPDSADVLKVCYSPDTIWVRAQGLTDNMGKYMNPGSCLKQNYVFRFPRNPVVATTKVVSPKEGAIGSLLNGIPVYGLTNAKSWSGTADIPAPGGLGIWNVEVGLSEGFVLDTAFGAHPQQTGAYHTHTTPYRFYRGAAAGKHSPLVGFAFDGYPIYGPYGYTNAMDSTTGVTRMKTGYSLRSITDRHTLPYGVSLTTAQYGPDINTTHPIGFYCEDYEWLSANGGDLDKYNGRFCRTPEYPAGTYAYFVTVDASGAAAFPYYVGIEYYGQPDQGNFGMAALTMPSGLSGCLLPETNGVETIIASGSGFSIYPNPASNHFTLLSSGDFTHMAVYNQLGATVSLGEINRNKMDVSLEISAGIYFVRCYNQQTGISEVQRLVIQ